MCTNKFLLTINTIDENASLKDVLNFKNFVDKTNNDLINKILSNRGLSRDDIPVTIIVKEEERKLSFKEQLEEFDKNYSDYLEF